MRIDRQEIQIYLRDEVPSFPEFRRGWNVHFTTELTQPVWFYVRGEEYSLQIDHFARCINDRTMTPVSTFETAIETDLVLAKMLADASGSRTDELSSLPRRKAVPKRSLAKSVKAALRLQAH